MLLHQPNGRGDFRVPVVERRPIEAVDEDREKFDRIAGEALSTREGADARIGARLEDARARRHFLRLFEEAAENGETGEGFVKRIEDALRRYKAERADLSADHMMLSGFEALGQEVTERALKTEAASRVRDRIVSIGKMIDRLVAATERVPETFRNNYEAARSSLDRLHLPEKVLDGFRARLPEVPKAALRGLLARDPAAVVTLIKRRIGPAEPAFGVDRHAMRLLRKRAEAALGERERDEAGRRAMRATRTLLDGKAVAVAVRRAEAPPSSLAQIGVLDEAIGSRQARVLKRDREEAFSESRRAGKAVAIVRSLLARGEKPDFGNAKHETGADLLYAREIEATWEQRAIEEDERDREAVAFAAATGIVPKALVRRIREALGAGETARAAWAARMVDALERADPKLVVRIDKDLMAEAHQIIDVAASGIDWEDAVRLLREGVDLTPAERRRREREFATLADGGALGRTIGDAFGITVDGISAEPAAQPTTR